MKHLRTLALLVTALFCNATRVAAVEIILTEKDGLLATETTNDGGTVQYEYQSDTYKLNKAVRTITLTFLEGHSTTGALYDKNGYPFVALAEFYLYDGEGNEIELTVKNFSTNAQEESEGPMEYICDDNRSTFFHSTWSSGASDYHNIVVTLPDGKELSEFSFKYITRYIYQCVPKKIKITADANSYEVIKTIDGGYFGNGLKWVLNAEGEMTISGTGEMDHENIPWEEYREAIKKDHLQNRVSSIDID